MLLDPGLIIMSVNSLNVSSTEQKRMIIPALRVNTRLLMARDLT